MDTKHRTIASAAKHAALTTFGKKLRKARLHAGFTQHGVGTHLGVTGQSVRNWETGRNEPSQEAINSLAALYSLHPEELKSDTPLIHSLHRGPQSRQRIGADPQILIQARKQAGLSQTDVSRRSVINIASIRRYERG